MGGASRPSARTTSGTAALTSDLRRRCRVGENWWYRGEHCEEFVSEPLVVGIAIASVAGFLAVAVLIVYFLAKMLREQHSSEDTEDPYW